MSKFILFLMPIIFFTIIILAVIYVARRMAWAFNLSPKITTLILGVIIVFFIVSMMIIMRGNLTSGLSHFIYNLSTIGFGVLTILIFSVLAVDLARLITKIQPQMFGYIVVGITSLVSIYSLWNAQSIKTYYQDVKMPNLEEPMKIAQLSDIHIGHFWGKKTVDKLVRIVEKESVDAVVITGDMFDGRVRLNEEVLEPFKRLDMPIYFIEGNHDGYSGSKDIKELLTRNGITVLDNEMVELKGLQIVGLDYLMADHNTQNTFHAPPAGVTIEEVLPTLGIDRNRASLMLHHNPIGVNYAADNGINLYLAGHTHAGQMFPATLIAKMMFPFNKGLYQYNDTTQIYVSQGSGTFGPPMRLGTRSEATILTLESV